jgi:hypothetical protein
MTKRDFADKDLHCASCGDGFVFSAGEQELYRLRGIIAPPDNCPDCARGRVPVSLRRSRAQQGRATG